MQRYNPKEIEPKWQRKWTEDKTYHVDLQDNTKPKFYGFAMLPYPSGTGLHTGHVRTYTLADVTVRVKRQQGFNAYNPIGWDAFGLPAENYAIKTGISPQETIAKATARFREQLTRIGMSHDWSKEINTSDPRYYKWTQWVFTKLFEHGLAYQKESAQWWCPVDMTVLANEQVEAGKCWRCGNLVEKKLLTQWFFKITDYADELLESADDLDWPDFIKAMQRNWIGRKTGIDITYQVTNASKPTSIVTFTTHPDTNFGATFIVVAPEHPFVQQVIDAEIVPENGEPQGAEVAAYKHKSMAKSDIERQEEGRKKTGVFTGFHAMNNLTGREMPIWVSDFALMGFGTGAVVGVPAHDSRDFEFAKEFNLPIVEVVEPVTGTPQEDPEHRRSIVAIVRDPKAQKFLSINWGKQGGNLFIGGGRDEDEDIIQTAQREIAEETGYTNLMFIAKTGRIHHHYFAHSKGVARQIEAHGLLFDLVDDSQQATKLEADEQGKFTVEWLPKNEVESKVREALHALVYDLLVRENCYTGEGIMVNSGKYDGMSSSETREEIAKDMVKGGDAQWRTSYRIHDWLISRQRYWGAPIPIVHCPVDGAVAVPEDQLPVVLPVIKNYKPDGGNTSVLAGVEDWVNTTCPKCGSQAKRETDTMDGYACSSWYFLRYLDPHNDQQAWDPAVVNRWMPIDFYNGADHAVSHLLYARFWTHFFHTIGLVDEPEPVKRLVYNAYILATDGTKMSKSKGNVVDPLEVVDSGYGADALRVYEMFIAPYDMEAPWDTRGVPGSYRFLQRTWNLTQSYIESPAHVKASVADAGIDSEVILRVAHKTIRKVSKDLEATKFNTAVAAMMEAVNTYMKLKEDIGMSKSPAWQFAIESLLQLLAPFAPHISEELWQQLGHRQTVHCDNWPKYDSKYLIQNSVTIAVQVNGKIRASLDISGDASEIEVVKVAQTAANVAKHLANKQIVKTIYIAGKIVNFVVK